MEEPARDALGREQALVAGIAERHGRLTAVLVDDGGQAGRDLAEMFELEMDLEKNQYETGNAASPRAEDQGTNEAIAQLEELARRQQQLADQLRQQRTPTPAQRWQQQTLQREAEELRRRLQEMQRQQQSAGQQDCGQQGAPAYAAADRSGRAQPGE